MVALPWWAFAAHAWTWFAVIVAAEGGLYFWSVRRKPFVKCWACKGTGASEHAGLLAWLFPGVFGTCWKCRGRKLSPRLAIRVFQHDRAEKIRSGK